MAFLRAFSEQENGSRLTGRGVYLREPRTGDFEEWVQLREESRSFLTPWEPLWSTDELTRAGFRRRLRRYADERRNETAYAFFIFRQTDERLVGGLTLSNIRRGVAQSATLGYWMGAPFAGQGYMSAAVRAVAPFVFERLRLRRLEAACLPHNENSIRLLEKIGFTREGYARQYLCIAGAWEDHVLFALLKGDPIR